MNNIYIQNGETERVLITALNISGNFVTGLVDVLLEIQRKSDGYYYDFNDTVFKNVGWTTRQQQMSELNVTNSPGVYYYDFNTSGLLDDEYFLRVSSVTAYNSPYEGYLKVGGFVDNIDASILDVKNQTDKMNFNGNNIQSRVADKGVLNNPPSETIGDYKDKNTEDEIKIAIDNYASKDTYKANVSGIPTNPLLTNDVRLDNLDTTISSRANENPPSQTLDDYKANISTLATSSELSTHDLKLDTVDGIVDRILKATEIKQCIITDASATSISFTTNLTEISNQFWARGVVLVTSGNNEGQMRAILNYNGSTKLITLKTPLDVAPAQNDTFIILTERKHLTPDIEDIIGATWDEPIVDHANVGSFGLKNQKAVPSETIDDYKANVTNLDVAVSTRSSHADPTVGIIGSPGKTNQEVFDNEKGTNGANTVIPPTVIEIREEIENTGTKLTLVKNQTDKLNFIGDDVKSTLDSEEVDIGKVKGTGVSGIDDFKNEMNEAELHSGLDSYLNKNDYKANVSSLAIETNATSNKEEMIAEINTNETKIDNIKIEIDSATYGLQALKNIFNEIKGVGWSTESLKAIYDIVQSSGMKDWTNLELKQIRDALGVDGDKIDAVGGQLQRILGLSQENYKWFNPVYNANHNLISVTIKIYANSSDYDNEVNEISTYNVVATYNTSNELITYGMKKI